MRIRPRLAAATSSLGLLVLCFPSPNATAQSDPALPQSSASAQTAPPAATPKPVPSAFELNASSSKKETARSRGIPPVLLGVCMLTLTVLLWWRKDRRRR